MSKNTKRAWWDGHNISRWYQWHEMRMLPSPPGTPIQDMRVAVHIRRWHPGYWLMIASMAWRAWREAGKEQVPHG